MMAGRKGKFPGPDTRPHPRKPAAWATEPTLRRLLILPSARKLQIVYLFYRQCLSPKAISRQTGMTVVAIHRLLSRLRGIMGKGDPVTFANPEHVDVDALKGGDMMQSKSFGFITRMPTRKHIPDWAYNDAALEKLFLAPAMLRYQIAMLYFVEGLPAQIVADRLGLKRRTVEEHAKRIRKMFANPYRRPSLFRRANGGQFDKRNESA